jgi:GH24 family phage-related lysozyme (muramidase)
MDAWNRTGTPWSAITKISDFQESVAYDPNGNILKYKRNGDSAISLGMDSLNYFYIAGTNKLDHITDSVTSTCSGCNDITTQSAGNYQYDSIGELTADAGSNITGITWTVYGKIASITKSTDTTIYFTYDAGGNRISKSVVHAGDTLTTWYTRDAQGNILSVYTYGDPSTNGKDLSQTELDIYGSSRLGMWKRSVDVEITPPSDSVTMPLFGKGDSLIFTRGNKLFELTNHLGNVLATISDKRYGVSVDDSTVTYFNPEVVSANDYYPFGMLQPGRQYAESNLGSYRYGFNGQEKTDEIAGTGNHTTAEFWEYDSRIGRRWNLDLKPSVGISRYAALDDNPNLQSDPLGDSASPPIRIKIPVEYAINYWKEQQDNETKKTDMDFEKASYYSDQWMRYVHMRQMQEVADFEAKLNEKPWENSATDNSKHNVNEMSLSEAGFQFLKKKEGFVGHLYNDIAQNATIGYGYLVHYGVVTQDDLLNGPFKDGITREAAIEQLKLKVVTYENIVKSSVKVQLTQNQYDALVSFTYNTGTFKGTTLQRLVNSGTASPEQISNAFGLFNKAKNSKGERVERLDLTQRRAEEAAMYNK